MKKYWLVSIAVIITLLLSSVPIAAASPGNQDQVVTGRPYSEGVVLVGFVPGTPAAEKAGIRQAAGSVKAEALSPLAKDSEKLILGPGVTVERALANLQHNPNVRYAEPDYLLQAVETSNDPYYTGGSLWGMYGDATTPANSYGSGAGEAWAKGYTGSRDVFVGVIDEGIQYTHPDLAANVWTNLDDPVDGVDNDGNGYIDDIHGWDFYYNNNSVYDGTADDHGTHVSGTIGADGGNGVGVAGVNWRVTLISTKFLGPKSGYTSGAVAALDYLTDLKERHGLNIVATNNSWGGGGFSQSLLDAINRSADEGMLFVAAAGNNGTNNDTLPFYPACYQATTRYDTKQPRGYDAVVAVAATTSTGGKASFSNYGASSVDIGAPGYGIYSTVPTNSYASYSGTSMATPHVTGAIALIASINPGLGAKQIRDILMNSSAPTASLAGITTTGGRLDIGAMANLAAPNPNNQPPTANNQTLSAVEDTPTAITLSGTDAETVELTFTVVDPPSHGSLGSIVNYTGSSGDPNSDTAAITYSPAANYNGADSFTFKVSDGTASSTKAIVTIDVSAVNDPPVITEGASASVTMSQDGSPTPFSLTLHATDVDSATLTWSISSPASHGTASASGTGDFKFITYTPDANYNGSDSFGVQVSDGTDTDTIQVNVTINPVDDPPADQTMHVDSIAMSTKTAGKNTAAVATVTIVDGAGNPVAGATVSGSWSGDVSGTSSGITDSSGTVNLQSKFIKNPAGKTFIFTLDKVILTGWTFYDSGVNTGSITIPK